jgi:hypothetical protein
LLPVEEVAVVSLVEVVGVETATPHPAAAALETVQQQFPGKGILEDLE